MRGRRSRYTRQQQLTKTSTESHKEEKTKKKKKKNFRRRNVTPAKSFSRHCRARPTALLIVDANSAPSGSQSACTDHHCTRPAPCFEQSLLRRRCRPWRRPDAGPESRPCARAPSTGRNWPVRAQDGWLAARTRGLYSLGRAVRRGEASIEQRGASGVVGSSRW